MNFVKSLISAATLAAVGLTAGCNSSTQTLQPVEQTAPAVVQPVQVAAARTQSAQQRGEGIRPIGREANYPVYPVKGDLDDINFAVGDEMYTSADIMKAMPAIRAEHVDAGGYRCEFLCVNAQDQVVGWNPAYAQIVSNQK